MHRYMYYLEEYLDDLTRKVFMPVGFEYGKDCVLIQDELSLGVHGHPSENLNQPLGSLESVNWPGSVVRKKGNWVWKNKFEAG